MDANSNSMGSGTPGVTRNRNTIGIWYIVNKVKQVNNEQTVQRDDLTVLMNSHKT